MYITFAFVTAGRCCDDNDEQISQGSVDVGRDGTQSRDRREEHHGERQPRSLRFRWVEQGKVDVGDTRNNQSRQELNKSSVSWVRLFLEASIK